MSDSIPSIVTKNLSKSYGKLKAISNVSFKVNHGEIIGFLGPNGAGKTTTMRILSGLIQATSGTAYINEISIAREPYKTKSLVAYMPENNPLSEEVRVKEYLRYRAHLKKVPPREQKARIEKVMDACGLTRTASNKIIGKLSKGYGQRVGIADTLLGNPKVVIMDEPTIGLDPHQILNVRKLIDSLRSEVTVLLYSHILAEIEASCDRVIIINQGRTVAHGTRKELREQFMPADIYEISVRVDPSTLEHVLKKLDADIQISHAAQPTSDSFQSLTLNTRRNNQFSECLIQEIQNRPNCDLREIKKQHPSLEHIFIAATRPSWETETDIYNTQHIQRLYL